jgi:NHL repeat
MIASPKAAAIFARFAVAALLAAGATLVALLFAERADASTDVFGRAWGKNVNGGAIFGICTTAADCQTGINGALGGEMSGPSGVATDASGNVYVADSQNHRIQKFDAAGNFQRAWGKNVNGAGVFGICTTAASCQAGTGGTLGGEMNVPVDITTDASGNVYVADAGNQRIQKFDTSGNWQRAWGKNVNGGGVFETCTAAASCQVGSSGTLGGEMNLPFGVATDASGNVYVAEFSNNRIQKFDALGGWQRAWGKNVNGGGVFGICTTASTCQAGGGGTLGGEFLKPTDVGTDPSGNVYTTEQDSPRIQKFDSSGNWQRAWGRNVNGFGVFGICTTAASCQAGSGGGLGGEMSVPSAVGADASGDVYVADTANNRIQKFDSAGNWLGAWGKNVAGGGVFEICTTAASCQAGTPGGLGGEMSNPEGVASFGTASLYVADRVNHRIQKFLDGTPTISTQATPNAALGASISDQATLSSGSSPGGTITFRAYGPADATCADTPAYTSNAIAVSGNGSYGNSPAFTPTAAGTYRWRAFYSGDANNAAVSTPCNDSNETSTVSPATPTITTSATANATIGASISDQATLSGGFTPEGTITFTAYGPNDPTCAIVTYTSSAVAVSGNGNYGNSPAFTPATVGTYRWRASYSGDTNNNPVSTPCNDANETSTVAKATPVLSTQATPSVTLGQQIADQATLSGGNSPGGTITFTAYGPNDATCANVPAYTSNAITVSGAGNYSNSPTFIPSTAGTYRWRASYSGDVNNDAVAGACNAANESSVVSAIATVPTIPTTPTTAPAATATGQRAAALKKCKRKKKAAARRKCKRRAKLLPV